MKNKLFITAVCILLMSLCSTAVADPIELTPITDEERAKQAVLLPRRATTLEQTLGRTLPFETVAAALVEGFAQQLNLTLHELPLTEVEQKLAEQLRAEQYANDAWNKRV